MFEMDFPKGTKIWNRGHTECGTVQYVSSRYCAACNMVHRCVIVKWPNGKTTKPCTAGLRHSNGSIEIE